MSDMTDVITDIFSLCGAVRGLVRGLGLSSSLLNLVFANKIVVKLGSEKRF